jgi:hypothetical protein
MVLVSKTRRRVKLSLDELLRRLRLGDLRKLFHDRYGPIFPEGDDAAMEDLRELLLPISMAPCEGRNCTGGVGLWTADDRMRHEIETWAPWMGEDEAQDLIDEINQMPLWQRKPRPRTLGERLNLTYAQRSRLRIQTIGPCDISEAGMALIRKQKKRLRDRARRQLKGAKSRAEYLATHRTLKERPWIAMGISRATYYRRIKQERTDETSPRQVNLTLKTELALVSQEKTGASAGECVRVSTATPAGLTGTCINEFELEVDTYWRMKQLGLVDLLFDSRMAA